MKKNLLTVLGLVICLSTASCSNYSYIELIPPGWDNAYAAGINNNGVVVGSGSVQKGINNISMGFIYSKGKYTELLPPGWLWAEATAINDSGVVVGFGQTEEDGTDTRGFIYNDGVYTELLPPDAVDTKAYDINNNGEVVGITHVDLPEGNRRISGFIYNKGDYTIMVPPGWEWAYATGINDSGAILFYGLYQGNVHRAAVYKEGIYAELLPPGAGSSIFAEVIDINNSGTVVGTASYSIFRYYNFRAFICHDGKYTVLMPPGIRNRFVQAYGINNYGIVAGTAYQYKWNPFGGGIVSSNGFIYDHGMYKEIQPPGRKDAEAIDVNDSGIVVGSESGSTKCFIAIPKELFE